MAHKRRLGVQRLKARVTKRRSTFEAFLRRRAAAVIGARGDFQLVCSPHNSMSEYDHKPVSFNVAHTLLVAGNVGLQ